MHRLTSSARRAVAVLAATAFAVTAPLVAPSLSQAAVHGHHASSRDADGDKMPSRWERHNGLDAHKANAHRDADHDGLENLDEFCDGTDPQDDDSDEDGIEDGDDDSSDDDASESSACTANENCDEDQDADGDRSGARSDDQCDEDEVSSSARIATFVVA
jgi:hypothetical protein